MGPPKAWSPVDSTARTKHVKPSPQEFYLMTNVPGMMEIDRTKDRCLVTATAWVTGGRKARLRLDGVEQNLDTGWSVDVVIPGKRIQTITAVFLDPVGGKVLATRETAVRCVETSIEPARSPVLYDARGLRGYEECSCPEK